MQILAISDVYFPRLCGVSTSLRTLMRELQAKGHGVTLIAPDYPGVNDPPGDDILRVSSYALPFAMGGRVMKMHRVLELTERLRSWNYDIIHIHTPFVAHFMGTVLARRLRVPVVETWNTYYEEDFHRYVPYVRNSWTRTAARWVSRFQCHGVDGLIVNSPEMQSRLQDYGIRRPITVIPAAVETHLFQRGEGNRFRAAHDIGADRLVLLYVGRLNRAAAVEFLLATLDQLRRDIPNVFLAVVGKGPAEPQLRDEVDRRDLRAHIAFVGEIDRMNGLLDCYNGADCFVFPADDETQGVALLEAMAAGLPVVATASVRTENILSPDSAAIVTEERVDEFVASVARILREPEQRAELATLGRQYVQRWSASVTVEQVLDCYQEVTALRHHPERVLAR